MIQTLKEQQPSPDCFRQASSLQREAFYWILNQQLGTCRYEEQNTEMKAGPSFGIKESHLQCVTEAGKL